MLDTRGYAAFDPKTPLRPFAFQRREPGEHDVLIDITHCGVCHSDLHQARDDWGGSIYPMVPGHEIVGHVARVGAKVTRFKLGDRAGVGVAVDSCRACASCEKGLEQYCLDRWVPTYNALERDGKTIAQGGYSDRIVVDERFALRIPDALPFEGAAPLLCAGITTYSPLAHWGIGKGHRLAVVGLGGLGHLAVKLAVARGAEVTLVSTSPGKRDDAKRLGAHDFLLSSDDAALKAAAKRFDFILDTVSAPHDYGALVRALKIDGTLILVGLPDKPAAVPAGALVSGRRSIAGSMIGGLPETQEMLDFCAQHGIVADVEVIRIQEINEAYQRLLKSDVRYRFVIDLKSLAIA